MPVHRTIGDEQPETRKRYIIILHDVHVSATRYHTISAMNTYLSWMQYQIHSFTRLWFFWIQDSHASSTASKKHVNQMNSLPCRGVIENFLRSFQVYMLVYDGSAYSINLVPHTYIGSIPIKLNALRSYWKMLITITSWREGSECMNRWVHFKHKIFKFRETNIKLFPSRL